MTTCLEDFHHYTPNNIYFFSSRLSLLISMKTFIRTTFHEYKPDNVHTNTHMDTCVLCDKVSCDNKDIFDINSGQCGLTDILATRI